MAPWFFLSYGRRDDIGGAYVSFFWEKLAEAVAQKAGLPSDIPKEEVGFFDRSAIEPGDHWRAEIAGALRTCRALVCLLSPSYLRSEYCGKEIKAFTERLAKQGGSASSLVLPILWDRPAKVLRDLPPVLAEIQFPHKEFGEAYAQEGLAYLVRRRKHDGFVHKFAERLVRAAEEFPLSESDDLPDLKTIDNAFCSEDSPPDRAPGPQVVGPTVAQFVFVAGCNEELASIRKQTDCYGAEGGRDWRPYYPVKKESIGILSQQVASTESLFYETLAVSDDLIDRIRKAEETNTIVLLLVDPWSIRLRRYESCLRTLDQNAFLNCSLLIPWNESDEETRGRRDELRSTMERTLVRSFIVNNIYVRDSVRSHEELKQEIAGAIGEVRRRMMQLARVFKRIDGAESSPPPKISATAGTAGL
jgi:FxsC-like protein